MYRLLGGRRHRRGDHRRRVGVAVLRLWLSRVPVRQWIRIWAELRLRPVCLCSGIRIFRWLLRTAPLLRAPLLPLLIDTRTQREAPAATLGCQVAGASVLRPY